jgi:hypothetical protein
MAKAQSQAGKAYPAEVKEFDNSAPAPPEPNPVPEKIVVQQGDAPGPNPFPTDVLQSTNLREFELHQIKLTTNKGKFTGAKIIDTLRTVKIDPVDAERMNMHLRGALEFYAPAGEYKLADVIDMAMIRKMSPGANWGEPTEEESE